MIESTQWDMNTEDGGQLLEDTMGLLESGSHPKANAQNNERDHTYRGDYRQQECAATDSRASTVGGVVAVGDKVFSPLCVAETPRLHYLYRLEEALRQEPKASDVLALLQSWKE